MFKKLIYFLLFQLCILIESKPLNHSIEHKNEIDNGPLENHNIIQSRAIDDILDQTISSALRIKDSKNISDLNHDATNGNKKNTSMNQSENNTENTLTSISSTINGTNILTTLLELFTHKIKFSPQTFFQDRLASLKDILVQLGITIPNNPSKAKQFLNPNGLIHLAGLDDNGFYTNRLQPAGFLSGNGWFANKGGLLGGPGAILSTGSILTDYPTPYRKK